MHFPLRCIFCLPRKCIQHIQHSFHPKNLVPHISMHFLFCKKCIRKVTSVPCIFWQWTWTLRMPIKLNWMHFWLARKCIYTSPNICAFRVLSGFFVLEPLTIRLVPRHFGFRFGAQTRTVKACCFRSIVWLLHVFFAPESALFRCIFRKAKSAFIIPVSSDKYFLHVTYRDMSTSSSSSSSSSFSSRSHAHWFSIPAWLDAFFPNQKMHLWKYWNLKALWCPWCRLRDLCWARAQMQILGPEKCIRVASCSSSSRRRGKSKSRSRSI